MLLVWVGGLVVEAADAPAPGIERFYIGTYSGAIYMSTLNLETAALGTPTRAGSAGDPSFVALTPDRRFLYAVNEGANMVGAYSINPTNGTLRFLNQVASGGGAPAHIVLDRTITMVIVANYNGGNIRAFPILADGKLGTATANFQHPGGSHTHCVTIDASNHFAFVCDKGIDQIRCYILDAATTSMRTNTSLITSVAAGSGPRHMAFDPQYKRAYVICETSSTVIGFDFDATNGVLVPFQTISTLPPAGFPGNTTAEIVVHQSGRFLYGSNRGYNTIVAYSINPGDGTLTQIQQQTTGRTPRNFAIDPTGAWCIVAGQDSSDIRLYSIDQQTGQLTDTGRKITVSSPVCIVPFILTPPQPTLALTPASGNSIGLNIGNSLPLLTYQILRTPALDSGAAWELFATGTAGQTNFVLTNTLAQEYFHVGVLTNY
jgi:6-phosphogluconolactonase